MAHATEPILRNPGVLAVLHAAQDIARKGQVPTHDRLCSACKHIDEFEVRSIIHFLIKLGRFPVPTDLEEPSTDEAAEMCRRKPGPPASVREFNLAIMHIIDDDDPYGALSVITGLTVNALKIRASLARSYTESLPEHTALSGHERSYLTRAVERRLETAHDPAVAEFAGRCMSARRANPSRRSMTRDHAHDRASQTCVG